MAGNKKILVLDATAGKASVSDAPKGAVGPIDVSVHQHLNVLKSYEKDVYDSDNALIFGCGPFAGSKIGGVYRATFFARSPVWKGLYSSNMGGAGIALYGSGHDFFLLKGKAKDKTIISVSNVEGKEKVRFKSMSDSELSKIFSGHKGLKGAFALEKFAFDCFRDDYALKDGFAPVRSFAVGPGALVTDYCGILSTFINKNGTFETGREDWAGRGGFGSLMAQAHNVVAIVIGGNADFRKFSEDLKDISKVNALFEEGVGKNLGKAMADATEKYRYMEKAKSGGTFGVNYSTLGSSVLSLNWSSTGFPETKRKKIYDELVKGKYLAEFNERVIKTRSWKTCGEVCPAMCKKIDGKMKIDYEPYEANGPNCGIFDLKSAEKVVRLADENGFDAIHIGTIISFVIEAKMKGLLDDSEIKGAVSSDGCGAENEKIARKVVELIIKGEGIGLSLRKGLRRGSKELDAVSGCKGFNDIAVYVANGEDGEIAPNQYWVPGFFLPLPIQGKFLTYYGADFMLPEKLGMRSAQRFMLELDTDNSGICRFHRGWSEKMTERLLKAALGKGFRHDIKPVVKDIIEYNKRAGALPQLPESKRVKEIMRNYLKKVCCQGNRDILSLLESFEKDLDKGCLDYFESVKKGIEKVFDVEY